MKKRFIATLICLLMVATMLVACSGGSDDWKRKIPGWDESKQNIIFYTWGSDEENAILQGVINSFSQVEGNEEINVLISKAGTDYYGDLNLRLTGNSSPDIVLMKPGYIQPYLRSNLIISLQEYINSSTVIDKDTMIWDVNDGYRYNSSTKIIGNKGDALYSLIKDFSPDFVMNYNSSLVNQTIANQVGYPVQGSTFYPSETEPMTFSQYKSFARAMQAPTSRMGAALDNEPFQQLMQWIQANGGSLYTDNDTKVADIKNTPEIRAAFDFYRELRDECTDNTRVALGIGPQIGPGQLKQGQAASIFYGRWAYSTYNLSQMGNGVVKFAPPPVMDDQVITSTSKYAGITAMVGMSIAKNSEYKDSAWKFIEYYFTEGQKILAPLGYNIPGNKLVAENEFLANTIPARDREINQFFYDLAVNNSFVIKYNTYMTQATVETMALSPKFSDYFSNSKGKPFNKANWEATLDSIKTELQKQLDNAVKYS